ncbi:MAG: ABC transporter permease, partial [Mesorhizobium sp.]
PTVMALGTAILAVSFVIAAIAEILRHRGLAAAQRPVPADLSKPEETERGELQWHST